jgi:hypothetical protein
MISGEAANTNFIVYGLTRWALKLMIYRIRGNPANRYTTNTVTSALCNTTFNNISVISWQSVLLVEETRGPGENHRVVIGTDCICISNYLTITATTAPNNKCK